jgi:hypothetical protein
MRDRRWSFSRIARRQRGLPISQFGTNESGEPRPAGAETGRRGWVPGDGKLTLQLALEVRRGVRAR